MPPWLHIPCEALGGVCSRRVIAPSWLSGLWRSFLYSSSLYSCYLFIISSASVKSISFLLFLEPTFACNVPLVSLIFLNRSLVFPILLFSSISLHWLLRKAFLSLLVILWNSVFKLKFQHFGHLMWRADSLKKTMMLGKIEDRRRRGRQRIEMVR